MQPTSVFGPIDPDDDRLRHYIIEVYAEPLRTYVSRIPDARPLDPAEVVNEFVIKKMLSDGEYLRRWKAEGGSLRSWIRGGIRWEIKTQLRSWHRACGRNVSVDDLDIGPSDLAAADAEFDRTVARRMIAATVAAAREKLPSRDHEMVLDHLPHADASHAELGERIGCTAGRVTVLKRVVTKHLRAALDETLRLEGWTEEEREMGLEDLQKDLSQ
ncbi:MAG: RNA polymerase sigma factor [Phycisphaerales bacterium]